MGYEYFYQNIAEWLLLIMLISIDYSFHFGQFFCFNFFISVQVQAGRAKAWTHTYHLQLPVKNKGDWGLLLTRSLHKLVPSPSPCPLVGQSMVIYYLTDKKNVPG